MWYYHGRLLKMTFSYFTRVSVLSRLEVPSVVPVNRTVLRPVTDRLLRSLLMGVLANITQMNLSIVRLSPSFLMTG